MSRSFLKHLNLFRRLGQPQELRVALTEEGVFFSDGHSIRVARSEALAPWRPGVDALAQILEFHRGEAARLVLADQFVRYALLPWSDTLKTHEQWLGFARHRFCAIHGPIANEWEVKFAGTAPAGPRLACAVDRELVEALGEHFTSNGVRLMAVQPYLVAAFNKVRGTALTPGGSCWMVVEEPGRLTLALFLRGVWVTIRSRRVDEHWRRVLPEIIERESAFLGLEEPCTRVIVCAQGPFDAAEHENFRTEALSYQDLAMHGG